jgi:hypothetical protein
MRFLSSIVGGESSESYGRYAEVMMNSSQLSPHVYIVLTIVASLKQSSNTCRALMRFLTKIRNLGIPSGATENVVPPELVKPLI